ncbi:uracil-DNA glycosylase [Magnetospirillum sp. ME-1]|uniref:uracil-DNA glycosylase family protein n=1 Tax=Magnetospirillum sp. ME-1 TaxID=1639348 RepID=UPI000A17B8AB|nr:uracil-DNA glycosylase family protein [Magnetospirillum sp. ME-1]ARJ67201.1 uracil-DNA glycosylase [Magnetospirillum sp. ME-1]
MSESLGELAARMRACRVCEASLPLGPRPVFRLSETARLLIIGQAPGTRVHETGIPWNDRSGDRLRLWLGLDHETFYDSSRIAILPTGLCYPGRLPRGGDRPPRPECAPLWHGPVLEHLPELRLTLLVGSYAQAFHLGERRKATLTRTVAAWRDYLPRFLVLPHPSWRTTAWEAKTPWFGSELLPEARRRVGATLA